jgi:hypothetical protein
MSAERHDPAARRRYLQVRISTLKRRVGVASVLGFGVLLGLVAEHAVGAHRHASTVKVSGERTSNSPSTFFDSGGATYSFDDSSAPPPPVIGGQPQSSAPPPVAQTSGS